MGSIDGKCYHIYMAYMDPMGIGIPQVCMDATEMRYPTIQSDLLSSTKKTWGFIAGLSVCWCGKIRGINPTHRSGEHMGDVTVSYVS